MNKQKILILGGTGFIGTNLVSFYSNLPDYEVFATYQHNRPDNTINACYVYADLVNQDSVASLFIEVQPDIVIHAAAVTTGSKDVVEKPYLHVTDNIRMNALVFEACHVHKVKHCLFMSCSVMYQPKNFPQKESDWNTWEEIYPAYFGVGNMKVYSERLCEFYSRLGNCKFTIVRNSNIYGPFDKFDYQKCHLMPATIRKVYEAIDKIEIWGDEHNQARRDLVHVNDLVNLIDKIIQYQDTKYEMFNCGAGKAYSVSEIVKTVQKVLKKENLQLIYNPSKPNIPTTVILDFTKAYEKLGWYPKVNLEDGIANTLEWYKESYGQA